MFVTLVLGPGIPILYGFLAMFLFFCYWIDKYLLLRFYRIPPNFNNFLNKIFNYTLLTGIFFHLIFAIWIYGNENIFPKSDDLFSFLDVIKNVLKDNIFKDNNIGSLIQNRLTKSHNILILCILVLFILYFILRYIFYNFMKSIFTCCCSCCFSNKGTEEEEDVVIFDAVNASDLYKSYQIKKLEYKYFSSNDDNLKCKNLKKYYEDSIYLYRHFLIDKLKKNKNVNLTEENLTNLKKNFEQEIKKIFVEDFNGKMKGEGSYNLAFQVEFEGFAFKYLTQGERINNKKKTEKILLADNNDMHKEQERKLDNAESKKLKDSKSGNDGSNEPGRSNNFENKDEIGVNIGKETSENEKEKTENDNDKNSKSNKKNIGSISSKPFMETQDFNKSTAPLIKQREDKEISDFNKKIESVEEPKKNDHDLNNSHISEFKIENQNEVDKTDK